MQKASQGPDLEVEFCHFYFILLAKASHKPTWGGEIDSTFSQEELQSHGKEHGHLWRRSTGIINIIKLHTQKVQTKIKPIILYYNRKYILSLRAIKIIRTSISYEK